MIYKFFRKGGIMECQKCGQIIEAGEEREMHGQSLCEDCYLDAVSPVKACDPWAVHSAKRLEQTGAVDQFTDLQKKILTFLKESGPARPEVVCRKLNIPPKEFEREFASLRHMEKARGEKVGDQIVVRLWD
jgi:hypothetical protein